MSDTTEDRDGVWSKEVTDEMAKEVFKDMFRATPGSDLKPIVYCMPPNPLPRFNYCSKQQTNKNGQ